MNAGYELAKALGIPTDRLIAYTIRCEAMKPIAIMCEYHSDPTVDYAGACGAVLKGYRLEAAGGSVPSGAHIIGEQI